MGNLVIFWSPVKGHAGVTASMGAVAAAFAMEGIEKLAVTQVKREDYALEDMLDGEADSHRELYGHSGLSALALSFKQMALTSGKIQRCALPLCGGTKFLLPGLRKEMMSGGSTETEELLYLLLTKELRKEYDWLFVDTAPAREAFSIRLLSGADIVVVVLPQQPSAWTEFAKEYPELTRQENLFYLIGNYQKYSRYGRENLLRRLDGRVKRERVGVIPMNTGYFDAMVEGRVIDFFLQNAQVRRTEENWEFIRRTEEAADLLKKSVRR